MELQCVSLQFDLLRELKLMAKLPKEYREQSSKLTMQARMESDPDVRATLLHLATGYAHLAELEERKAKTAAAPIVVPQQVQEAVEGQPG